MSQFVLALLRRATTDPSFRATLLSATPDDLVALGLKPGQQAVLLSNLLLTQPFRPEDLPDWDARYGHAFPWLDLRDRPIPWTPFEVPAEKAKIAFVTTAGVYRCGEPPFEIENEEEGDPSYRVIPTQTPPEVLCVKHHLALVRTGTGGDINHLLPLRAGEHLQREGVIGELAAAHYSFMGYIPHTEPLIERTAPVVARQLNQDGVHAVILVPV